MFKVDKVESVHINDVDEVVRVSDIIIPEEFSNTRTSKNKIRWAKEYYQRNGHFDKPISVVAHTNEDGYPNELLLVDEYSRYLAAVELKLQFIPVIYIDINTYCEEHGV